MSIAREGYPFIAGAVLLAALAWVGAFSRPAVALWAGAVVFTVVTAWMGWFFRDPEREGPRGEDLVIAPADGRVVMIHEVDEPSFLRGRVRRISIFMNVLNVHVNRYPVSGTVQFMHYNPGKFLHAASEKSSLENEQQSVGIAGAGERVLVRQIAGLIARRIVNYSREGGHVEQGERMGLIRFGSRVDVFVPLAATVRVAEGERATAGVTVLATLGRGRP